MDDTYTCPESPRLQLHPSFQGLVDSNGLMRFTEEQCHRNAGLFCNASCGYPFLFDRFCRLLRQFCPDIGFSEFSRTKERDESNHLIVETITTKGLFVSEDKAAAIWPLALSDEALPNELIPMRDGSVPASHTFKGEYYYLVRLGEQVFAYNIDKFNDIELIINHLNYEFSTPIESIGVHIHSGALVIRSSWMIAVISRLQANDPEEEERVILSERLKESQPFFEFKVPLEVDWSLLKKPKDDTFQELCRQILLKEFGIEEVISIGKTRAADRGRDLEVHQKIKGLIDSSKIKWLVQCKFSSRSISPDSIKGWTDRVREHGYDGFWLITNNDITPDLFDQFKGIERNTDIKVKFWQRGDLHTKLNIYPEFLKSAQFFNQPDLL